ncbi:MAG: hypothetical protein QOI03_1884 [Solirubrobacteraceae bacterium]|nr:hypothetical protein [Solirubrobacteraceae bacterium]
MLDSARSRPAALHARAVKPWREFGERRERVWRSGRVNDGAETGGGVLQPAGDGNGAAVRRRVAARGVSALSLLAPIFALCAPQVGLTAKLKSLSEEPLEIKAKA